MFEAGEPPSSPLSPSREGSVPAPPLRSAVGHPASNRAAPLRSHPPRSRPGTGSGRRRRPPERSTRRAGRRRSTGAQRAGRTGPGGTRSQGARPCGSGPGAGHTTTANSTPHPALAPIITGSRATALRPPSPSDRRAALAAASRRRLDHGAQRRRPGPTPNHLQRSYSSKAGDGWSWTPRGGRCSDHRRLRRHRGEPTGGVLHSGGDGGAHVTGPQSATDDVSRETPDHLGFHGPPLQAILRSHLHHWAPPRAGGVGGHDRHGGPPT